MTEEELALLRIKGDLFDFIFNRSKSSQAWEDVNTLNMWKNKNIIDKLYLCFTVIKR